MKKKLAALVLVLLATPAVAQESTGTSGRESGSDEATERMEEHLEKSKSDEQGTKEAPGGGAEPTENWFGCPPEDEDKQERCEEMNNESGDEKEES